jgi:hypothetical protein
VTVTRRRTRDEARERARVRHEQLTTGVLAPQPMTPEQVADLVQRARETSVPDKAHPTRWERYRRDRWRPLPDLVS